MDAEARMLEEDGFCMLVEYQPRTRGGAAPPVVAAARSAPSPPISLLDSDDCDVVAEEFQLVESYLLITPGYILIVTRNFAN
jgi:hypothetical protein